MNANIRHGASRSLLGVMIGASFACGGGSEPIATIEVPDQRAPRISVTAALDVSALHDPAIADRIVVEEITVNVADVRLLGADPKIPAGGYDLLPVERVVSAYDGEDAGIDLPFPRNLLAGEDLAVYVRLDRSVSLEGASVIVRGRIYAKPPKGGVSKLTEAPDPDGDPADDPDGEDGESWTGYRGTGAPKKDGKGGQGIDPDGDPAHECAIDPDGDPASPPQCRSAKGLHANLTDASVPIELRGEDIADLVAALDSDSLLDVVIGIPAARWLTPETMAAIDRALEGEQATPTESEEMRDERDPFILEAVRDERNTTSEEQERIEDPSDEYSLTDELRQGGKVRRD
jgi:hypothetical protein